MNKRHRSSSPLGRYFQRHRQAIAQAYSQCRLTPLMTVMTILVIGIALALPTGLFVLFQNAQHISRHWDNSAQISVYLKDQVSSYQIRDLSEHLEKRPDIASVRYVSPTDGLAELEKTAHFGDALQLLTQNPLPPVLIIQPTLAAQSSQNLEEVLAHLKQNPLVAKVDFDVAWVKRLYAIIQLGNRSLIALFLLFGVGVLVIIGITTHFNIKNHQQDITLYQLIGATRRMIRRPFLYHGLAYGFLGSLVSLLLIKLFIGWVNGPIQNLIGLYHSHYQLTGLSPGTQYVLFTFAALLGLLGASLAVNRFLD